MAGGRLFIAASDLVRRESAYVARAKFSGIDALGAPTTWRGGERHRVVVREVEPKASILVCHQSAFNTDRLAHNASTDRLAPLAEGKAHALLDGHRRDEAALDLSIVARHHHLRALVERDGARHVGGAEEEL